jgi:hypothetical protein
MTQRPGTAANHNIMQYFAYSLPIQGDAYNLMSVTGDAATYRCDGNVNSRVMTTMSLHRCTEVGRC